MVILNRRHFIRQTAFAATLCSTPLCGLVDSRQLADEQGSNDSPLDAKSIHKLASQVRGNVITPENSQYETARLVFNRAFDRHPAVIVRCSSSSDVARALEFAQTKNLPLAVRGGGHSRLGYGMCDGGLVIDLSQLKRVHVDPTRRVARAEAGSLVRDLDEATQSFDLATTSGGCPTVGIAGFTLGGGEGRLMEKYGAACDNLLSAEVVTVDGRHIEASHENNSDLFWAIRGGGGNFGVVTALEYQLHPVGKVLSGALTYPPRRVSGLLEAFSSFLAAAPDEMDAFAQIMPSKQGEVLRIDVCHCGDLQAGMDLIKPMRALKPQDDTVRVQTYLDAQAAGGFILTPVAHFQTNVLIRELSGEVIAAISLAISNAPATCKVIIVPLRGAVSRVGVSDMAFALRQPGFEIDIAGVWREATEQAAVVRWVQATRDSLQPFAHGVYVNQLGDTSDQLVRSAYGSNYARLMEIKKKYDPTNLLRLNQNIKIG
jgi:hypothetical protein